MFLMGIKKLAVTLAFLAPGLLPLQASATDGATYVLSLTPMGIEATEKTQTVKARENQAVELIVQDVNGKQYYKYTLKPSKQFPPGFDKIQPVVKMQDPLAVEVQIAFSVDGKNWEEAGKQYNILDGNKDGEIKVEFADGKTAHYILQQMRQ
ncbi:hypothetical protein V8J88_09990 [Massilia sp. W12]|uniref:hypothetical protein n=1 Tax=Massilia sp. W12 TaxID=3126507 RepID=UPI0030D3B4A7